MTNYAENPFRSALSRNVVETAHFIGRDSDVYRIEDKIIFPENQRASVAIIGLPDIGKHCLVNKVLLESRKELHQRKLLPIEIDLRTYTESEKHDFFRDLISLCWYELKDELEFAPSQMNGMIQMTKEVLLEWDEGTKTIFPLRRFFKHIYRSGIQVIFILNNFDHADSLFTENLSRIQWLRDLSGPEYQVTWIVLSCKPIPDIKKLPPSISVNFFYEQPLEMFSEDDLVTYFYTLVQMGVLLSEEHKNMITNYCGRHPYLLSLLGYHLIEDFSSQTALIDVKQAFHKAEEHFYQCYERIINLVLINDQNEEKLQTLLRMLFDQTAVIEQKDIDRMLAYGLISPNPAYSSTQDNAQTIYSAFSPHFQNYLYMKHYHKNAQSLLEETKHHYSTEDPLSWSQTILPQSLLWNRYKIVERLEPTAHSQVLKAWDIECERHVAIKCLYLDPSYGQEIMLSFKKGLKREAKILGSLKYKNIGSIYDVVNDPPAIIMEWIAGKPLDQVWEYGKGLTDIKVIELGIKLADALTYIHTRKPPVIHRDIKPQNIILREDGEPFLIDFDVAQATGIVETILPYDEKGYPPAVVGTLAYSAPEQLTNPKSITDRADIYALGIVLYEAFTGGSKPPLFLSSHNTIPAQLWYILSSMISKDPQSRPDAQKLSTELERCLISLKPI